MKYVIVLLLISSSLFGQQVDYNTIILPKTAKDIEFSEKLVRLAWQNSPQTQILNHEVAVSNLQIKQSRRNWLDNVRITGNLNEFNIKDIGGEPNPQSLFFPRYNISASIGLGTLFGDPLKTKIEKEGLQVGLQNINQQKIALRADVLSRYETYLMAQEIFEIRVEMMDDAYSDFQLKEAGFSRGDITLFEYNNALDKYNQLRISKILSERDLAIAKIELEELIGMKLNDVQ